MGQEQTPPKPISEEKNYGMCPDHLTGCSAMNFIFFNFWWPPLTNGPESFRSPLCAIFEQSTCAFACESG